MNQPSELLDRLPPHDAEAERDILGSVLLAPECIHDIVGIVAPSDFYVAANQAIFAAMLELQRYEGANDITTLASFLQASGDLAAIGGRPYLVYILEGVAISCHAAHYAGIVREKARLRDAIHLATDLLRDAYAAEKPADEILRAAEHAVSAARDATAIDWAYTAREAANEAIARLSELMKHSGRACMLTGLRDLDQTIGGMFTAR